MPGLLYEDVAKQRAALLARDKAALRAVASGWKKHKEIIERRVESLAARIVAIEKGGGTPTPDLVRQLSEYRNLQKQAEAELRQYARYLDKTLSDLVMKSADAAYVDWYNQLRKMGLSAGTGILPKEVLQTTMRMLTGGGPLELYFIGTLTPVTINTMFGKLEEGLVLGRGPREIAKAITSSSSIAPVRAMRIARTEMLRAYRMTSTANYRDSGVVETWKWLATKDERTCIACIAMDGTVHELSEELAAHIQCRCTTVPFISGRTGDWEPLRKWIEKDPELLEKKLGGEMYKAFKKGEIDWDDIPVRHTHPTFGDSIVPGNLEGARARASSRSMKKVTDDIEKKQEMVEERAAKKLDEAIEKAEQKVTGGVEEGLSRFVTRLRAPGQRETLFIDEEGNLARSIVSEKSVLEIYDELGEKAENFIVMRRFGDESFDPIRLRVMSPGAHDVESMMQMGVAEFRDISTTEMRIFRLGEEYRDYGARKSQWFLDDWRRVENSMRASGEFSNLDRVSRERAISDAVAKRMAQKWGDDVFHYERIDFSRGEVVSDFVGLEKSEIEKAARIAAEEKMEIAAREAAKKAARAAGESDDEVAILTAKLEKEKKPLAPNHYLFDKDGNAVKLRLGNTQKEDSIYFIRYASLKSEILEKMDGGTIVKSMKSDIGTYKGDLVRPLERWEFNQVFATGVDEWRLVTNDVTYMIRLPRTAMSRDKQIQVVSEAFLDFQARMAGNYSTLDKAVLYNDVWEAVVKKLGTHVVTYKRTVRNETVILRKADFFRRQSEIRAKMDPKKRWQAILDDFMKYDDEDTKRNRDVYYYLEDLQIMNPEWLEKLLDNGFNGIYITATKGRNVTNLNKLYHLAGSKARGWSPGSTVDNVRGLFTSSENLIAINVNGRGVSEGLFWHEIGHAIDHMYGTATGKILTKSDFYLELYERTKKTHLTSFTPYNLQPGDAGPSEWFAMTLSDYYHAKVSRMGKNMAWFRKRWGDEYTDWMENFMENPRAW